MTGLLRVLWGDTEPDPATHLDIYRRILTQSLDDGYRRAHRQTQQAHPRTARQWPLRSRHYHATAPLVAHDERRGARHE